MVDSHFDRMELLYRLDTFHLTLPISYLPQSTIFLGRTVNWIMEIFHYSKFCLLIPLYLDPYFIPFDKLYVPTNLESSITAMLNTALAFITYSNNQVDYDSTFLFYSKTMFIAALCYCVMRKVKVGVIEAFMEAIRLTGYPQDYDLLWEGSRDPDKAQLALLELLTF